MMMQFVNPYPGNTTDRRAVCGRSACTVRREGEQFALPTPILGGAGAWDRCPPAHASCRKDPIDLEFFRGEYFHRRNAAWKTLRKLLAARSQTALNGLPESENGPILQNQGTSCSSSVRTL
jgi:hypothetical protein